MAQLNRGRVRDPAQAASSGSQKEAPGSAGGNLTPEIERKGDVHPYTSVNGHMFTYLDQTGTLGILLPHEEAEAFQKKYNSPPFVSYGVVKKDWVTVPETSAEEY